MTRKHHLATGILAAAIALPGCQTPTTGPQSFEAREAAALVERATTQFEAGAVEEAIRDAERGLIAATESGEGQTEASARRLLGLARGDAAQIEMAATLSRAIGDMDGTARADLAASRLFVSQGRASEGLGAAREGLAELAPLDVLDYAELLARLHHAEAAALRALGRRAEAAASERRADLALTTLADDTELPLRLDVALALGSDSALTDPHTAFRHHARASWFARRTNNPLAELRAVVGMAGDCLALGRRHDAAAMIERALSLALAFEPPSAEAVAVLEVHLRRHLLALNDGPGSVRWGRLDALLHEHADRLAREAGW